MEDFWNFVLKPFHSRCGEMSIEIRSNDPNVLWGI